MSYYFRLGIGHDGDVGCKDGVNIMSTEIVGGKGAVRWSSCSRRLIQKFLRYAKRKNIGIFPKFMIYNPY